MQCFRALVQALLFALGAYVGVARAEQAPSPNPLPVTVGIYLNQIYNVNLKDNQFTVDFYIWFRWPADKQLKPLESFEIMNGHIESKSSFVDKEIKGQRYVSARVVAVINKLWDLREYPRDAHTLELQIEDSQADASELVYVPDDANSGASPVIRLPGWELSRVQHKVQFHTYDTNYGDVSLPTGNQSRYSRFLYSIQIGRPGVGGLLKAFLPVLISTFVSFLAFLVRPTNHEARFALGIGALFTVVASEIVVASGLPESDVLTLADKLHLISVTVIFLTLLASAVSLRLYEDERATAGERLDRVCLKAFPIAYLLIFALLIQL